jgi:hypothetical protein
LWGAFDLVPGQQRHSNFVAQLCPRGVAGRSLWCQHSHDVIMAEGSKTVAILEYLAQAQPKLFFLVVIRDALNFGNEDRSFCFPGNIEVGLTGSSGSWLHASLSQDLR